MPQTANTEKKLLPTGIQTFAHIRNGNYYYVDKTPYLLELAKKPSLQDCMRKIIGIGTLLIL